MSQQIPALSREEQAKLEIGHTHLTAPARTTLLLVGLVTLSIVPVGQAILEMSPSMLSRREDPWPQCCDILRVLPQAATAFRQQQGTWTTKTVRANSVLRQAVDDYEKALKSESFLTRNLLPPTQSLLVAIGCGNEQAYVGRESWLFYRPGIDYCTGPGFLNTQHSTIRGLFGAGERPVRQADPRPAIIRFHRELAQRNIQLVLMPTPDKASVHPEQFSSRFDGLQATVHNPSYGQFIRELTSAGILVCDVTNTLTEYRDQTGSPAYLATDSHWRPEAMEMAAVELARFLREHVRWDRPPSSETWLQTSQEVRNRGDIAMMLRLSPDTGLGEEAVTIQSVTDASHAPWRPDPKAEVLLLGDSFANIYSLEAMNWGGGAGLAERLSVALGRSVDTILRNDDGAYATRELLCRDLSQGVDRLDRKSVVVWQFAARELAVGDWKVLATQVTPARVSATQPPVPETSVIVRGTIAAKSAAPRAGQMTYAHHIFTLDLTDVEVVSGAIGSEHVAVYMFSMRDQENTAAFAWPVGKRVTLQLHPWRPTYFRKFGRINRTDSNNLKLEQPWWGEVLE